MGKLEKISAWNLTKVRSKKQVIDESRTSGATVHFASLMDICHLKNRASGHGENQPPDVGVCGRTRWAGERVHAGVGVPVWACRGVCMGAVVSSRVYMSVFVWVRGCLIFLLIRCIF